MPKVYIKSQGCQMNVYDADRLADLLQVDCQLERVFDPEDADVLLLNTCAIREKSQEKVFSEIGRWNTLKKRNPDLVIGVGGCVASQEGESLLQRAPYIDVIFGPQTLHRVPALLTKNQQRRQAHARHGMQDRQNHVTDAPVCADNMITAIDITFPEIEKFDALPQPSVGAPEAFVSIMEGCSKYCSFCVVPYTRGEEYSRPFGDIMREVHGLVQQGVREIHFLGQNVNAYLDESTHGKRVDLADLIRATAAISNVARIRYTTSHPLEMTDRLIDCYADTPKLVSHLHLPIQSGSDKILGAMKRGYTADYYREIVAKLYKARPNLVMSSDFIVGFPGESEDDFQQTLHLVKDINFDTSFSFLYSPRPGTPAAQLVDTTSLEEKKQRLARLQAQLKKQAANHAQAMKGKVEYLLISDFSKRSLDTLQGRLENNRIVHIISADPTLIGQVVQVRVNEVLPHCLRASLV